MVQFKAMNLPVLIDTLSDFRFYFKEVLNTGSDKEIIESFKCTIQLLQNEIDYRNRETKSHYSDKT